MVKHNHIVVRAEVNKAPKDIRFIRKWIRKLIKAIGMKMLGQPMAHYVNDKGNKGLTCLAILNTSHIAVHTWDETDPALLQLDVYSCGTLDKKIVFEHLQQFEPKEINYVTIDREKSIRISSPS
ncbi:MAG: S-adenosylmethionine decarboxylase [Pelagibacterales bacterium]|nr:S-adenosylmethionine decarboxylase [Pelagibacterales bacterium]